MAMHSSAAVTQLLLDWNRGDAQARDQMLPLVYDELRRLARAFLAASGATTPFRPPRSCTRRISG